MSIVGGSNFSFSRIPGKHRIHSEWKVFYIKLGYYLSPFQVSAKSVHWFLRDSNKHPYIHKNFRVLNFVCCINIILMMI